MKIKIPQSDLAKSLLAVNKSLLTKVNLPILSNILISASKGSVEILSTNLEIATKAETACKVEQTGKTTIPGKLFLEFVSQLPEGEVTIEKLGEEVLVSMKK